MISKEKLDKYFKLTEKALEAKSTSEQFIEKFFCKNKIR